MSTNPETPAKTIGERTELKGGRALVEDLSIRRAFSAVVAGVATAAVLWLFSSVQSDHDKVVVLETKTQSMSDVLNRVDGNVQQLLHADAVRSGREDRSHR